MDALLNANKQSSNLQTQTTSQASDLHVVLVNGGLFTESKLVPGIILESSLISNSLSDAGNLRPLALALLQFPLSKVCFLYFRKFYILIKFFFCTLYILFSQSHHLKLKLFCHQILMWIKFFERRRHILNPLL